MRRLRRILAGLVIALSLPVSQAMATPNPMMAGKAFERLPYSRGVVGFGEDGVVVVTDNPRYVVKGELWDMWSNAPVPDKEALQAAEQRMPLSAMNIDLTQAVNLQQGEGGITVFLDPASPTFVADLDQLNQYTHWQLVLIPLSRSSLSALKRSACHLVATSSLDALKQTKGHGSNCKSDQVMRSAALASFLHITHSPTIVDAKGKVHTRW